MAYVRYDKSTGSDWLKRFLERSKIPYALQKGNVAAGMMLKHDFEILCLPKGNPRTFNWDRLASPSPTTGEQMIDYAWFDNSTASRFEKAMRDAGPLIADLLYHFICLERGMEKTEQVLHLPARSGKVLLVPGLIRLYKFYQADPKSGVIG